MSNFFSSPWYLEASAATLFSGSGARPGTVEVEGLRFDALVLPDGTVATNPMSDYLEPQPSAEPPERPVAPVRYLPRVATPRVGVARAEDRPPHHLPSPFIDWREFASWDDFVARTSALDWRAFRTNKRKRRKLSRSFGPVSTDLDARDHDLVEHALLHKARQLRQSGRLDRFASCRTRQLVHRLVDEGHLRLSVLSAGGRPLAFAIAHWGPTRLDSWINSYDPDAAACSPGILLFEAMMRESLERGHAEFDFLIGDERYKYLYATHERLVRPIGRAPLGQRVAGGLRHALEADERPRRLRRAAYQVARHSAQASLGSQGLAPLGETSFQDAIEARAPDWPSIRFIDPASCQLDLLFAQSAPKAGRLEAASIRITRSVRHTVSLAAKSAQSLTTDAAGDVRPLKLRPGECVRVKAPQEIASTPGNARVRPPPAVRRRAGETFRVQRRVGAAYDPKDQRIDRPPSTVVLEGVVCEGPNDGHGSGCGRQCPLLWNEAWLERVEEDEAPSKRGASSPSLSHPLGTAGRVRVLDQAAIERSERSQPDPAGVRFTPETMAQHCGRSFVVKAAVAQVYDHARDRFIPLQDVFLLEGATCPGALMVAAGRCDRRCSLLWRGSWLEPSTS